MKRTLFYMLVTALLFCGQANAQKVLLPLGQHSMQPWSASFYHASNYGEEPADNWFATDFDDSGWGTIEGPISTASGLSYFATPWDGNGTTYWVRRHFTCGDLSNYAFVYLYLNHDDGCEVWLNGERIYQDDNYYTRMVTVPMTQEMRSLIVEGDNVVAVKVYDNYGEAFMDFGIEASNAVPMTNPDFNDYPYEWAFTGEGFSHGGQSFNYIERNLSKLPFDVHQTVRGAQPGLYRVRVQAFESLENMYDGWVHYQEHPASVFAYFGESKHKVACVFDEALGTNIYNGGEFYRTPEATFVPTYMTSVSIAFQRGMYENEFYAYADGSDMNIGIGLDAEDGLLRWTCFDNFRLDFISENELNDLIAKIEKLAVLPIESESRPKVAALLEALKAADGYEAKCRLIAASSDDCVKAKQSYELYDQIRTAMVRVQGKLQTGKNMSAATVAEATALLAGTQTRLINGDITSAEGRRLLDQLASLEKRLDYLYLDITITVPGSLGDSILNKVENFTDVQSLKVAGTLDDADMATIQSRLTSLCELDMTGMKMTAIPNQLFYQHSRLEMVKLPATLTTIGEYAFYQCYGLRNIDFPATLTAIGYHAFAECDNLQEVILPEGFTTMGSYAFYSCDNNKRVKLPSTLTSVSSNAFSYNLNLKDVEFAEGLRRIEDGAFYNCEILNNLKFPTSLYYIGNNAFAYNRMLSVIEFNEGLFQIADNAFYDCDALTEVTLPSSLVLAYQSPFDYCDNLKKVTCLSIEPPYMTDQIPYGLGMEGRELYVPALSLNVYKQTAGWDRFQTIKPIDYLPENFTVLGNLKLTLPETIPADYKPNVSVINNQKDDWYLQYGSLTVNGDGVLSMKDFSMLWDPNYQYDYYDRSQNYCTLVNNSHLRADNVFIDVYTRNDRWTFLTLPFDVKVGDIEMLCNGTTNWVIRRYDGQKRAAGETADTWVRMNADDMMNAGEGYIIQGSRYVGNDWQAYSGFRMKAVNNGNKNNIFRADDITVTLADYESEFAHNRSWNLIGNPYPCYYDTRFMQYDAPITVWSTHNNTYTAYSPADDDYILLPGEAFFVQRPVENGTVLFGKDGRQINRTVRNIELSRGDKAGTLRTIVNLTLSDGSHSDRTRVVLNEQASLQYEMGKDAGKFMSTDATVPQIFTSFNGVDYAINERPMAEGTVDLSLRIGADGLYTIALGNAVENCQVVLEDRAENRQVVLSAEGEYVFSAKAGSCAGRFVLRFTNEATGIGTWQSDNSSQADKQVYNLQGQRINSNFSIRNSQLSKGVYIQNGKKIMLNK